MHYNHKIIRLGANEFLNNQKLISFVHLSLSSTLQKTIFFFFNIDDTFFNDLQ
jgi:hypothetical protein